ncbi:MAG: alkaline phosphatase [Pseudomonadota bacterium]
MKSDQCHNRPLRAISLLSAFFILGACAMAQDLTSGDRTPSSMSEDDAAFWQQHGELALSRALARQPVKGRAKGIVLFLGDGMGVSTVTASRIYEGQQRGVDGESNALSFDNFPHSALIKTYNVNQQTADSAGTMSAIVTGVKTDAGLISVAAKTVRGNCDSSKGQETPTLLEILEDRGWRTGVISTARLTHATPAATYSHAAERGWESDKDLSTDAREAGCADIARQLIEFPYGDGLEVALGGGRRAFLPESRNGEPFRDPEYPLQTGRRTDGRHLGEEWTQREGAVWLWNRAQFLALDADTTGPVLGLFNHSHMQYELDRESDPAGEPSLEEMTAKAIEILSRGDAPFFLMVEAGRIDHGHHATNAKRAFEDTAELSRAVAIADAMTDDDDTLIIVTADHSHVMTIAGYATRNNDILDISRGNLEDGSPDDQPATDAVGQPYTTIGYTNGRGGRTLAPATEPGGENLIYDNALTTDRRLALEDVDTTDGDYHQESLVPAWGETHGGEDVGLYAKGPWAHLFGGTHEQSFIYYVMRHAACGVTCAPSAR